MKRNYKEKRIEKTAVRRCNYLYLRTRVKRCVVFLSFKVIFCFAAFWLGSQAPLFSQGLEKDMLVKYKNIQPNNGTLINTWIPIIDTEPINGINDNWTATYKDAQELERIGLLLKYGAEKTQYIDSIRRNIKGEYLLNKIMPLSLIDLKYKKLNPILEQSHRIILTKDSTFDLDLVGFNDDVYIDNLLFGVSVPLQWLRTDFTHIVLDSNLYIGNISSASDLTELYMVCGGKSNRVNWNEPVPIPAEVRNGVALEIKIVVPELDVRSDFVEATLPERQDFIRFTSKFQLGDWVSMQTPPNLSDPSIELHHFIDPELGLPYAGLYTIHYGKGDMGKTRTCLERPLILVEGIDFGYKGYPLGKFDNKYGENGYVDLLEGKSWHVPSQNWKQWESIEDAPAVIQRLRNEGFDVVYVDFYDGAEDMSVNAEVLINVLQDLQDQLCGRQMHVVGVSMGGVIAERAVRLMENRKISHCITSITGFDAPFQGANIALGLQHLVRYLKNYSSDAKDLFHRVLRRPATRQLLANHESSSYRHNKARQKWLREDSLFGKYPTKPWLFAVSNGSSNGKMARMKMNNLAEVQPGGFLARLQLSFPLFLGLTNNYLVDVYAENFHNKSKDEFYSGRIHFLKKFYSHKDNLLWDHVAGSYVKKFGVFEELGNYKLLKTSILSSQDCFVPTVSSLDLSHDEYNKNTLADVSFKVNQVGITNQLTNDIKTPFDRIYTPASNQPHVKLDSSKGGNIDWLISQLKSVSHTEYAMSREQDYNFRAPNIRVIPSVEMRGNGTLEINGVGDFPKLTSDDYKKLKPVAERNFFVGGCTNSDIFIKDSARFYIGQHNQKTTVYISSLSSLSIQDVGKINIVKGGNKLIVQAGSVLELSDNSELYIGNGSQLIIESGATLKMAGDSKVYLDGDASLLHIKGRLELGPGYVFKPMKKYLNQIGLVKLTNVGYGYGDAQIVVKDSCASFQFYGNGRNGHRNIQIEGNIDLDTNISNIEIRRSSLVFAPTSWLNINNNLLMDEVLCTAVEWANSPSGSIQFLGDQLFVEDVEFYFMDTALLLSPADGSKSIFLKRLNFYNNNVGLSSKNTRFYLKESDFEDNIIGLSVSNIWKESMAQGCYFTKNSTGLRAVNASEQMGRLILDDNLFEENSVGVHFKRVLTGIKCNQFKTNTVGVLANESVLHLDKKYNCKSDEFKSDFNCGFNTFVNNRQNALQLNKAEMFLDGENAFFVNRKLYNNQKYIKGSIRVIETKDYYETQTKRIKLGENFWSPISSTFKEDSIGLKFVNLSNAYKVNSNLKYSASIKTEFPFEACYKADDYRNWDQFKWTEESIDQPELDPELGPIVQGNKIRVNGNIRSIDIFDLKGSLLHHLSKKSISQIELREGVYIVVINKGTEICSFKLGIGN